MSGCMRDLITGKRIRQWGIGSTRSRMFYKKTLIPSGKLQLGWMDSNHRVQESKSCALPLGDSPIITTMQDYTIKERACKAIISLFIKFSPGKQPCSGDQHPCKAYSGNNHVCNPHTINEQIRPSRHIIIYRPPIPHAH